MEVLLFFIGLWLLGPVFEFLEDFCRLSKQVKPNSRLKSKG